MKRVITLSTLALLTACQSTHYSTEQTAVLPPAEAESTLYERSFSPYRHHKQLQDYVEQMIMQLLEQNNLDDSTSIAVASFVDFDQSLTTTSMLGNQLAENFLVMLPHYGLRTVELKGRQAIDVSPAGDLAFSRSQRRSISRDGHCCVLAGTLIYAPAGIEVYARLFRLADQQVMATSKTTIPYFVVNHMGTPR